MAKKVLLMKLLQEIRGYDRITNRRPAPRPPAFYLLHLRARNPPTRLSPSPQRLAITADWQNSADVALPVRINHFEPGQCELPVVIG